jgi:hypothetical protein
MTAKIKLSKKKSEIFKEHAVVLRERRAAMSAPNAQFFTWKEAQQILANRKVENGTNKDTHAE